MPRIRGVRVRGWALLAVLTLLTAACGGETTPAAGERPTTTDASEQPTTSTAPSGAVETSGSTTSAPEPSTPGGGECTVTITGDREEVWTFEQAITSFSTDYWLSEEDLRSTVEFLGEEITGGSYEEITGRGEPIITFLQISCSDPDNLIQGALVLPTNATRATDLPMGPGTYPISGGLFDADGEVRTMIADVSVNEDEVYGTAPGSGSLEITRWDLDGIVGSFSFAAREAFVDDPQDIEVMVQFSFVCREWFSGC